MISSAVPVIYLKIPGIIQVIVCNIIDDDLASRTQSLFQRRDATSLFLLYKYFRGNRADQFFSFLPRQLPLTFFTVKLARYGEIWRDMAV